MGLERRQCPNQRKEFLGGSSIGEPFPYSILTEGGKVLHRSKHRVMHLGSRAGHVLHVTHGFDQFFPQLDWSCQGFFP